MKIRRRCLARFIRYFKRKYQHDVIYLRVFWRNSQTTAQINLTFPQFRIQDFNLWKCLQFSEKFQYEKTIDWLFCVSTENILHKTI